MIKFDLFGARQAFIVCKIEIRKLNFLTEHLCSIPHQNNSESKIAQSSNVRIWIRQLQMHGFQSSVLEANELTKSDILPLEKDRRFLQTTRHYSSTSSFLETRNKLVKVKQTLHNYGYNWQHHQARDAKKLTPEIRRRPKFHSIDNLTLFLAEN